MPPIILHLIKPSQKLYLKKILKTESPVKTGENGETYLPAGKYKITIELNGNKAGTGLTLVAVAVGR